MYDCQPASANLAHLPVETGQRRPWHFSNNPDPDTMKSTDRAQQQTDSIADVQSSADTRRIPIDKVGIKDIRHPVRVKDRSEGEQHTIATFNMYVNLPHNFKGTHMSRFVEILNLHEREITVDSFKEMLHEMTDRLEADAGHIEMNFHYFINKAAPVTGVERAGFVMAEYGTGGAELTALRFDLFGMWIAAIPIVAWGAPLGSYVAGRMKARQLVYFAVLLALAEVISTLVFLDELHEPGGLIVYTVVGMALVGGGLYLLAKYRRVIFGLPGLSLDESLGRGHLDVVPGYEEQLSDDESCRTDRSGRE